MIQDDSLIPAGTKGLIFDIDGTLVSSMGVHFTAWQRALYAATGRKITVSDFARIEGLDRSQIHAHFSERFSMDIDLDILNERHLQAYNELSHEIFPIDHVLDYLRTYHKRFPIVLATAEIRQIALINIAIAGIEGLYDHLITAEDVKHKKPHPEVFHRSAQLLGLEPEECCIFEDSTNGLLAARRSGAYVIDIKTIASDS